MSQLGHPFPDIGDILLEGLLVLMGQIGQLFNVVNSVVNALSNEANLTLPSILTVRNVGTISVTEYV